MHFRNILYTFFLPPLHHHSFISNSTRDSSLLFSYLGIMPLPITITVCICTHNRPKDFNNALTSVLNQTFTINNPDCVQIVVVDDASSIPYAVDIVDNTAFKNILLLQNEVNLGLAASRNLAISHSTSNWFCFLDDDDQWCPNYLDIFADVSHDFSRLCFCSAGITSTFYLRFYSCFF